MAFNVDLYKNFKVEEKYKIFLEELENYLCKRKRFSCKFSK